MSAKGLKACYIAGDQEDEGVKRSVISGKFQLVIFTPEMLLNNNQWRRMLFGEVYSQRL